MNHSRVAIQYAKDVASGKRPEGLYVRLACERFLRDLARKDWRYEFSEEHANRAIRFMELLPHTKGKWAAKRQRLALEPWQKFVEANIFGWVDKKTKLRRFREVYEEEARKNGKSIRLAARGLYMLCADGETGAEVYSGATTGKQALEIFRPAWQMAHLMQPLRERFGLDLGGSPKNPGAIFRDDDMSKFEPLIGKPGDGASPHCALVDEYHEHETDHFVETMRTGMGAREQPLLSIITTAGTNLGGPCYQHRSDVQRILKGEMDDDRTFAVIYTLDDEDAWHDPAVLCKANPNYGVSVSEEFLLAELDAARRSATKQSAFRTKHLNQWVGAKSAWMNMLAWQRQKADVTLDALQTAPCWIAVDLASKKDVAAVAIVWRVEHKYITAARFYVPEAALEDNERYRAFCASGDMIATPGSMIDQEFIEEDLLKLCGKLNVQDLAFDEWQANYLMSRLQKKGLRVIAFNQTVRNMSDPMKEVEARVLSRTLVHDGNPVMAWMMGNVCARRDAKDNIYPRKDNDHDPFCKIDGPVALIMAFGRALASEADVKNYQLLVL
jgi:phage terminase large subunit-like protein